MPLDIDTPLQHPADEPARRHSENLAYDARQREALRQAIRSLYVEAERQLRRSYATAGSEAAGDYSWELVRQDDGLWRPWPWRWLHRSFAQPATRRRPSLSKPTTEFRHARRAVIARRGIYRLHGHGEGRDPPPHGRLAWEYARSSRCHSP